MWSILSLGKPSILLFLSFVYVLPLIYVSGCGESKCGGGEKESPDHKHPKDEEKLSALLEKINRGHPSKNDSVVSTAEESVNVTSKGRSFEKKKLVPKTFNVTLGRVLDEAEARRISIAIEPWMTEKCIIMNKADFDFVTDMTPEHEAITLQATLDYTEFHRNKFWPLFDKFDWKKFKDPLLKRMFRKEALLGTSALPVDKLKKYTELKSNMTKIYSLAKVCEFEDRQKCEMALDPNITQVFANCRDPEELKHYWIAWRDATGPKMIDLHSEYVEISNEAAKLNGYHDMGGMWRRLYEEPLMPLELWTIWGQIRPLYEQLHSYVRRRLHNKYGNKWVTPRGTIPAHLLGNMWAQNWFNIWDIVAPYPNSPEVANMDITEAMVAANYTALSMFHKADEFFQSLGLLPVAPGFWENSIFERPPAPKQIACHPEAWDLCSGKDFRIKMCATVSVSDFLTAHHEMGHIQYYMQYKDQLGTFREGANPGFHEAIGDTIGMSVGSPTYLQSIGLLSNYKDSHKNTINYLLNQALKMLVDLPWALVLEQWRWDVFSGVVNSTQYNCHWWNLRSHFQGIKPPVTRSWQDFDPGAKYHIPNGTPYDRYFVARILTYHLQEALCKEAGQYRDDGTKKPLYLCSIHGSKEAGKKLTDLLKLGSSVPWPIALEKVTGKRKLDATPVLNYFAPLSVWLQEENKRNRDEPGWEEDSEQDLCTQKDPIP